MYVAYEHASLFWMNTCSMFCVLGFAQADEGSHAGSAYIVGIQS